MLEIFREHLRGLALLALGLGGALELVDQWLTPIPVGAMGFSVLFYIGVGSGAARHGNHAPHATRQVVGLRL